MDSSVAMAPLIGEDRIAPPGFWDVPLVSSKLLEYEVWTRLHAYSLSDSHGDHARALVGRIALIKLDPLVLSRALQPFPVPVRTLDALHLASFEYLLSRRQSIELASYDERMLVAARKLGWPLRDCG